MPNLLYYSANCDTPQCYHGPVEDFLQGVPDGSVVRILGLPSNAELITSCYAYAQTHAGYSLQLASPLMCANASERANPEVVIYRMRQCRLHSSLGGWHVADVNDYASYRLVHHLSADAPLAQLQVLLDSHPAYTAMRFVPTLNVKYAARVLGDIVDPRWFVSLDNPTRLSRLKNYLGLSPRFVGLARQGIIDERKAARCFNILAAWQGVDTTNVDMRDPANFLWRRWADNGGDAKGDLRASQAFVTYVVRTWQHELVNTGNSRKIDMFLPESFFRDDELNAYVEYRRCHTCKK